MKLPWKDIKADPQITQAIKRVARQSHTFIKQLIILFTAFEPSYRRTEIREIHSQLDNKFLKI